MDLQPYCPPARKAFLPCDGRTARTKDDLADLINVALEELVRCRFELSAFGTLDRAAHHARVMVAHGIYRRVEHRLSEETRTALDALFVVESTTFWSAWQDLKRDPASPTLTHLVSISEQRQLLAPDLFVGIPHTQAEEQVLYPTVARLLRALEATGTMSRDHLEVIRLTEELEALRLHLFYAPLSESDEQALRRVFYGLYAIIKLHLTKEEEIYLPIFEARLPAEEGHGLVEAMERMVTEARSSLRMRDRREET